MNLTNNIVGIIILVVDMLKTIQIFPGFSLFMALVFLMWVSVIMWLLGALAGIFNFRSGGGGDSDD